ncbi:MAG: helix-turn-helix domain-containing protein [Candidatus Wallbacteria bacterium]|nr:helix-turn-helix domain-containing protein [Candidatus Wallbacteria bacterium]
MIYSIDHMIVNVNTFETPERPVKECDGSVMDMKRHQSKAPVAGFGQRLKQARTERGISGPALAAKLGTERSMIPTYEVERAFPSLVVLARLSETLQVSLDWLVFGEKAKHNELHDRELSEYFRRVDQLEARERTVVKLLLQSILKKEESDRPREKGKAA